MTKKKEKTADKQPVIEAVKGFGADWKCRDMQYQLGGTFEHAGKVEVCKSGLHACEYPLDVFGYYAPIGDDGKPNRFALVEASGEIARHSDDSKIAAARLTIKAELKIPEIISRSIAWVLAQCEPAKAEHATGYRSASSATGDQSASSATGYRSAALAIGRYSTAEIKPVDDPDHNQHAVAIATGENSRARAPLGCWIVVGYRNDDGELIHLKTARVGTDGIEPNRWYRLNEMGEFVGDES